MTFPLHESGLSEGIGRNISGFIIGLVAGVFGGMVGLGGGLVMVPLMVRFLGMGQHKAHGTSLAALILTGAAGASAYWADGNVDLAAAALLAAPAVVTAAAGARHAHDLPEWRLKKYFGMFLLLVSLVFTCKLFLPRPFLSFGGAMNAAILLAAGAGTGFISGMLGVGGGTIMVPVMVLLAGMGQHAAQGSSLLAMVPAGFSGTWAHWKLGNVVPGVLAGLLPGILIGSFAGGTAAGLVAEAPLRILFILALVLTGGKYILSKPSS